MFSWKLPLFVKLFPAYLFLGVLVLFYAKTYYPSIFQPRISNSRAIIDQSQTRKKLSGQPVLIELPAVGINLPVKAGTYDAERKEWVLSFTAAYFATVTSVPNNTSGNTLIYAHNTSGLFGPTTNLKEGDKAMILTDNNLIFEYVYDGKTLAELTNTEIFSYQGPARLTLLTCAGSWNSQRSLMYFRFSKVYDRI